MSRFGLDLLGRENPPPGYFSASEYQRIHMSGEPSNDLPPQVIVVDTSFRLLCPKESSQYKPQWTLVNSADSGGNFDVMITAGRLAIANFQNTIAEACNERYDGAGTLIRNALKKGSPRLCWNLSMHGKTAPEFAKSKKYTINTADSFDHWMNAVVELGKDRTMASLAILMVNPNTDRKSAKAVVDVKKHILTVEAAQKASSSHPAPDHPSDMITAN